jgi:hypothetical protein
MAAAIGDRRQCNGARKGHGESGDCDLLEPGHREKILSAVSAMIQR